MARDVHECIIRVMGSFDVNAQDYCSKDLGATFKFRSHMFHHVVSSVSRDATIWETEYPVSPLSAGATEHGHPVVLVTTATHRNLLRKILKLLLKFHVVVVGDAQGDVRDLSPKLVLHLLNTEEYFAPPFGQCSLGFGTDTPSARATK